VFDILSLSFENFRSYAGKHQFELPAEPGLYFLTGLNQAEPKLGSNGAGKSTLLDAIYWCLFGRTLRGLKAGDVVTWGKKGCAVNVTMVVGDETATIARTQNPNSLGLNGKPVDQDELQKYLRLTPDSFAYTVIMPQFGQSFFELTPTNKLALFSQIMGLDYWLDRSQEAASKAETIKTTIGTLTVKIQSSRHWVEEAADEIDSLLEKQTTFDKVQKVTIADLDHRLDEVELRLLGTKDKRKLASEGAAIIGRERQKKLESIRSIEAAHAKHVKAADTIKTERVEIQVKLDLDRTKLKRLSKLGAECPTCLQQVDKKHLEAERSALEKSIGRQSAALVATTQRYDESSRFASRVYRNLTEAKEVFSQIVTEDSQAKSNLVGLNGQVTALEGQVTALKGQLLVEQKRPNPYQGLASEKQRALSALKAKLKQFEATLQEASANYEAVSYWVAGFKRLRLFLIEDTLRALELEVNNNLSSLGLVDWQVAFDVERENKSGGLTKGFVVFIQNSSHPEPVRWESWSGGEAQRLQLAGDLGLANLIMTQAGLTNTIEFYDEPSKHLSQEGLLDLAEALHQRALDDGKRIFLIDHRTIEFGDFADVIQVTKTGAGSSLG
jgi:DNA repair exonuclease SbcCD ATPase subunit